MLDDQQISAAPAVDAHDVGLRLMGVRDRGNVANMNRRSVGNLYWKLIEVGHGVGTHVQIDVVLIIAHLGRTRRDHDVCCRERVADVCRRNPVGIEQRGIQVHHHGPLHAAERRRAGKSGDGEELDTDEVKAVIEQLLLGEYVAEHVELRDRNVRRVIGNNLRRHRSAR